MSVIGSFVAYVKQAWANKPSTATPVSAERLTHIEDGIKGNNDMIKALSDAVISEILNDPNKIASMAALYAVNQKVAELNSKLINGGYCLNPNSVASLLSVVNGWNSSTINIPTDATNKFSILVTIWVYGENIGNLAAARNQALITQDGAVFARYYENSTWSEWLTK